MAKPKLLDSRFDFSGGMNQTDSPWEVGPTEATSLINFRLMDAVSGVVVGTEIGGKGLVHRGGTQRIHTNAIGTVGDRRIDGMFVWDAPGGSQCVAIASGRLYHKLLTPNELSVADFTEVIPGVAINGGHIDWATFRASSSGAPLVLYFAASGQVWKWTGSALTQIDGTNSVPAASVLRSYGTRMFYGGIATLPKHLYWSKVGNAEDCGTGGEADGGSGMVDVLSGDGITALATVGSSLLIFTDDAICRLTGVSSLEIRIEQDTAGIATAIGARHKDCVLEIDRNVVFLDNRGVFLVGESADSLTKISQKLTRTAVIATSPSNIDNVCFGTYFSNGEIWMRDSFGQAHVFNGNAWTRFSFSFNPVAMARYVSRAKNADSILLGGDDGFIRSAVALTLGTIGDDLTIGGASPNTVTATAIFGVFPQNRNVKALSKVFLWHSGTGTMEISFMHDSDPTFTLNNTLTLPGFEQHTQRADVNGQGKLIRMRISTSSTSPVLPILNGFELEAYDLGRPV